jgi:DNA-binding SARP family transcriptional activator/tetratricopeptide (TPR) repeat protein
MAEVTLKLLGRPELRKAGASVSFPTRKTLALLAYCVLEPTIHARPKLASMLWPNSDDVRARGALRYTLSQLRAAFGDLIEDSGFVAARDAVGFERRPRAIDVDVNTLERACELIRTPDGPQPGLADVLALAEGELMDGFSLPDSVIFEEWLLRRRAHYARRVEALLRRVSETCEARGDLDGALELAERWRAQNPIDEASHRRVIQVLLARGERGAAADAYEACRACMASELGAQPSAETEAIVRRAASIVAPKTKTPSEVSEPLDTPLVGRGDDLALLIERYRSVCEGRVEIVVVAGEAGIGKTRLATDFSAWAAAQGADPLQGRAFEMGGRLPYQPLVDALRPRIERENAPDDLLDDVWLTEIARLLVELRERYPDLPAPGVEDATSRTRLFEALTRLIAALSERAPVVLLVDDVQWADLASLDVLHYAIKRWIDSRARVLLIFTVRSEALAFSATLPAWLAGFDRSVPAVRLSLEPLRSDDTRRLVRLLSGSDTNHSFADWLHAETGGHPFFITQTLRTLVDAGHLHTRAAADAVDGRVRAILELPPGVEKDAAAGPRLPPELRQIVRGRVDGLSPHSRTLLVAAAVLGRLFTFEDLREVSGLPEDDALGAMDELVRARLLRETDSHKRGPAAHFFSHDKIRDVVYAEATDARRRVFHRRAVELLGARLAPAGEIVHHALAAGLDEIALTASMTAGADAVRVLAPRDAIRHFAQAVDLATRLGKPDVAREARLRQAKARARIAQWSAARRDLEDVLLEISPSDREGRAEVLVDLSEAAFWCFDVVAARASAQDGVTSAALAGRADLEAAAWGWMGGAAGADGDLRTALGAYDHAMDLARRAGLRPPAHVLEMHSETLHWTGRIEGAVEYARAAIEAARASNDVALILTSYSQLCLSLGAMGEYAEAWSAFEESRRCGREYAIGSHLARALNIAGGTRLEAFDFAAAQELAEEASELARAADFPPAMASASMDLLFNFVRRGDVAQGEELVTRLADLVERAAGFHGWLWRLRLQQGRAEIALARARWRDAVAHATGVVSDGVKTGRSKYHVLGLTTRARARAELGKREEALADLREAVPLARATKDAVLFLRVASVLLPLAGNDALLTETSAIVRRLSTNLCDGRSRKAFEEGVRNVLGLTTAGRGF